MTTSALRIKGIAGDNIFMDHHYMVRKLKSDIENENLTEFKPQYCEHYLAALEQCFLQIKKLCIGDIQKSYLNWIRWNKLVLLAELSKIAEDLEFNGNKKRIVEIIDTIESLMEMHFHLDNTEKGTINEYHHVFEQIQRKEKNFKRAKKCQVQQAGRLLINYVSFLINKCYTETLDRPDYCQERLESEVDFLATTLKSMGDAALGDDITETWKNYKNFCELDNAAIIGQDKLLEQALELAHKRATENVYQSAIRQIHERIKELEEVCQKRISEIVSVSKVLKTAVINPGNTLKNLKGFIKDPKGSIKALRKYAKKHPWRFAAICIGSLTIGLVCGGAVAATVAIVDIFVPFSIPVIALAAVAIGTGAVSSTALVNVGVTAEAVVKIENEVNEEIGIEIAKEAEILNQNIEDGKQIASDIKFDQERRKEINKLEKKIFEQKKVEQETREKINKMALVELEGTKEQLDVAVKQLTAELEEFKKDSEKSENMVNEIQEKMSKIDEGKAAASWFVQDAQEKNSSSRMDESSGDESSSDSDFETISEEESK